MQTPHVLAWLALGTLAATACSPEPTTPTSDPLVHSFAGSEWSEPVWLGPVVNSPTRDLGPELSPDGLSLYFNSERAGGYGGMDLWVSRRACDGCDWTTPVNLGATLNTAGNEEGPALSADGHLLFFGSTRDGGYGGADLYVSWRSDPNDDLAWGPPVNLGEAVNTAAGENVPAYMPAGAGAAQLYFNRGLDLHVVTIQVSRRGNADGPVVTTGSPTSVTELNDSGQRTGSPSLRGDGRELVFWSGPGRGGLGGAEIWSSTRQSAHGTWDPPALLGAPINSGIADLEAALSRNGRTLVFARAAPGGPDLWISTRVTGGEH